MGNAFTRCLRPEVKEEKVSVIFWGGTTRTLNESQPAGKLMFEFPDRLVCNANSFFIGQPVPVLSIGDDLLIGETYFVIPADLLSCQTLTPALVASLSSGPADNKIANKNKPIDFGENPFQYVKNVNGDSMIKVSSEFLIAKLLATSGDDRHGKVGGSDHEDDGCELVLCSTPELRKHYDQLVRPATPPWSPKLETISERQKKRLGLSPIRLLVK